MAKNELIKSGSIVVVTKGILKGAKLEVKRIGRKYIDYASVEFGHITKNVDKEAFLSSIKLAS